jgi:hypothetical protein
MKKYIVLIFGMLFLSVGVVLAQGDSIVPVDPNLPVDLFDALNLNKWLADFALLVSVTTFFATLFNGFLKTEKSWIRKAVAWVVCLILGIAGKLFGYGFIADLDWIMVIVTVALGGLGANGLFDVPGLQGFWYLIESLLGNLKAKKALAKDPE